jgi:hypothetical protein
MYCDRSAYYQKAIKATARRLKIYSRLLWLFLLFGRLILYWHTLQTYAGVGEAFIVLLLISYQQLS